MKKPTSSRPKVYGYARVSTQHQRLARQKANILAAYPDVDDIVEEKYTGTTAERPEWKKLEGKLAPGDTVIFDEVSRMSRSAEEGAAIYEELYNRGVNLVFLKQPLVNTDNYRQAAAKRIAMTGEEITDTFAGRPISDSESSCLSPGAMRSSRFSSSYPLSLNTNVA